MESKTYVFGNEGSTSNNGMLGLLAPRSELAYLLLENFIAVALGFLRANVYVVAISMFLGKAIRYWVWMEFVYLVAP